MLTVVLQCTRESMPGMTQVADMTEVQWLAKLPDLRVLWLSDNPCAETPNYRHKVRFKSTTLVCFVEIQDVVNKPHVVSLRFCTFCPSLSS